MLLFTQLLGAAACVAAQAASSSGSPTGAQAAAAAASASASAAAAAAAKAALDPHLYPNELDGSSPANTTLRYGKVKALLKGYSRDGFDYFLGIPYGQPPTGALRFQPPVAVKYNASRGASASPSASVKNTSAGASTSAKTNATATVTSPLPPDVTIEATFPRAACMQNEAVGNAGMYGTNEDCLTLNIVAPQGSSRWNHTKLPVMVFIHGGGFVGGAATTYARSSFLVERGVRSGSPIILVTINYRLGLFGFPYGKEAAKHKAANLGLRDQMLAFEWVKTHIRSFGGDPNKITAFGESAGAMSIAYLMLDPGQTLFRGAIMESGTAGSLPMGKTAELFQDAYDRIALYSACGNTSDSWGCLSNRSAVAINAATAMLPAYQGPWLGPSIDGDLITASPYQLIRQGKFARIPFVTGCNKDEGTNLVVPGWNITAEQWMQKWWSPGLPNRTAAAILEAYPNVPAVGCPFDTGNQTFGQPAAFKQYTAILTDAAFMARRRWLLQSANKHGWSQTWSYQWTGTVPGEPDHIQSGHGLELRYLFGLSSDSHTTVLQQQLSQQMQDYWINFAYTRTPNGWPSKGTFSKLPRWTTYGFPEKRNSVLLAPGNVTVIQDDFREDRIGLFNEASIAETLYV